MAKEQLSDAAKDAHEVIDNSFKQLAKDNRKDTIFNSIYLGFLVVILAFNIAVQNWNTVLFLVAGALWLAVVWVQDRHINLLRHMLRITNGINELKDKATDRLVAEYDIKLKEAQAKTAPKKRGRPAKKAA